MIPFHKMSDVIMFSPNLLTVGLQIMSGALEEEFCKIFFILIAQTGSQILRADIGMLKQILSTEEFECSHILPVGNAQPALEPGAQGGAGDKVALRHLLLLDILVDGVKQEGKQFFQLWIFFAMGKSSRID